MCKKAGQFEADGRGVEDFLDQNQEQWRVSWPPTSRFMSLAENQTFCAGLPSEAKATRMGLIAMQQCRTASRSLLTCSI